MEAGPVEAGPVEAGPVEAGPEGAGSLVPAYTTKPVCAAYSHEQREATDCIAVTLNDTTILGPDKKVFFIHFELFGYYFIRKCSN